ncbi:hypothetical protein ABZW18_10310 [Streptomyces sp. NPDC004647]|uniref:hypothetical protein n=1 Tax=Streptomyces sp. NPDC004647 TaxID=3154671 RepID=UPI0033A96F17
MRTARTLFASAAITAVLAISAPAANAMTTADDWGHDSGSSSGSDHRKDSWQGGGHEKSKDGRKPHGGVHTGGGALATADDWDHEKSKDGRKPHGGVHTGGGGLADSEGGLAAGSLLALGGIGAGAYILRRRTGSGTAAA